MRIRAQLLLSTIFCLALVLAATPLDSGAAIFQAGGRTSDYSGQGMPFSPQELQSLVAPIALSQRLYTPQGPLRPRPDGRRRA